MGIVTGTIWLFNLLVVMGGYLVLLVSLSLLINRLSSKSQLLRLSLAAWALALPLTWLLLDRLLHNLPEQRLYILTAFTEITWRPGMAWLALVSVGCCALGSLLHRHRAAWLFLNSAALVAAYAGLTQAVAGLFFANVIFRAYGFELFY